MVERGHGRVARGGTVGGCRSQCSGADSRTDGSVQDPIRPATNRWRSCSGRTGSACRGRTGSACRGRTGSACAGGQGAPGRAEGRERTGNACRERTGNACRGRTGNACRERTGNAWRERTGNACRDMVDARQPDRQVMAVGLRRGCCEPGWFLGSADFVVRLVDALCPRMVSPGAFATNAPCPHAAVVNAEHDQQANRTQLWRAP